MIGHKHIKKMLRYAQYEKQIYSVTYNEFKTFFVFYTLVWRESTYFTVGKCRRQGKDADHQYPSNLAFSNHAES